MTTALRHCYVCTAWPNGVLEVLVADILAGIRERPYANMLRP